MKLISDRSSFNKTDTSWIYDLKQRKDNLIYMRHKTCKAPNENRTELLHMHLIAFQVSSISINIQCKQKIFGCFEEIIDASCAFPEGGECGGVDRPPRLRWNYAKGKQT